MKFKMKTHFKKLLERLKKWWQDPWFLNYWVEPWYSPRREDKQLTIRIHPPQNRGVYRYYGRSSMFIEDMYLGVMPFTHVRGIREKFPVILEPTVPTNVERIIAKGVSMRDHTFYLLDGISNFIRETTHTLFQEGVAYFEITTERDAAGNLSGFDFESIQPYYIYKFLNSYYQVIPWWVAKASRVRVQIVKIPASKILRIDFPKELGGRRGLTRTLKRIWKLGKEILPEFHTQAMERNENIGFDISGYAKDRFIENARLTRVFGWNQRSNENVTEYYSMVRHIRERRVEAMMRDLILRKINDALSGPELNLGTKIITQNLPSTKDVDAQLALLKKGNVAFMDIFNSLKID